MTTPLSLRKKIRNNLLSGPTVGLAPGFVQCNLIIVPSSDADEFTEYCEINPQVCPIIAKSDPGDFSLPELGEDIDIRRDLGAYNIYRNTRGFLEASSIEEFWREDFITFAYGCSFSFEAALEMDGIDLAYRRRGQREALYLTNIETNPTRRFSGKLIVSMRPFHPKDAIKAISVTDRFPGVHGAPVHIGLPELIGVDLSKPHETLGPVSVEKDEIPLFWACGITPQLAITNANLEICITHKSANMLITDLPLDPEHADYID